MPPDIDITSVDIKWFIDWFKEFAAFGQQAILSIGLLLSKLWELIVKIVEVFNKP